MKRTIKLKYPAVCADCGEDLEPGDRARYYGPGRVYGVDCHERRRGPEVSAARERRAFKLAARGAPEGQVLSALDPYGAYTADGRKIGSTCGCEDYPCCGH